MPKHVQKPKLKPRTLVQLQKLFKMSSTNRFIRVEFSTAKLIYNIKLKTLDVLTSFRGLKEVEMSKVFSFILVV